MYPDGSPLSGQPASAVQAPVPEAEGAADVEDPRCPEPEEAVEIGRVAPRPVHLDCHPDVAA